MSISLSNMFLYSAISIWKGSETDERGKIEIIYLISKYTDLYLKKSISYSIFLRLVLWQRIYH